MLRATRVAILVGTLTITIASCGDDNDGAADAAPAGAQDQITESETSKPEGSKDGREVRFETSGVPVPTLLTTNCNPEDADDCILPTNFSPTDVTGDARGTAFGSAAVINRNGLYTGVSVSVFTGEVERCGTGSLVLTSRGTTDPSTGETDAEWTISEDGGTGELADVTGSGTSVVDAQGGRYEGRISCG
jgi:hypothetical protein